MLNACRVASLHTSTSRDKEIISFCILHPRLKNQKFIVTHETDVLTSRLTVLVITFLTIVHRQ